MKWTITKIRKMTKEELQRTIDRAKGAYTVYSGASKQELINEFVHLVNKGIIN